MGTVEEKRAPLKMTLDAVYVSLEKQCGVSHKPRAEFVPLPEMCRGLREEGGLFYIVSEEFGIGDPEGIRTPDLHRDRVAC